MPNKILIVDDSVEDGEMLCHALSRVGVQNKIHFVPSCADAQAFLATLPPHPAQNSDPAVIFLDLHLSEMDGFELIKWIRAQIRFDRTLIVAFSGLNDLKTIRRVYSLGANTFIFKPAQTYDLENLIQAYPGYWNRPA